MNAKFYFFDTKKWFLAVLLLSIFLFLFSSSLFAQKESYNYMRGKEAYEKDDYETAKKFLDLEISENKKNSSAYALRAFIYMNDDDKINALGDLNNAIKYSPSKKKKSIAYLYKLRGDIYKESEDYPLAMDDYNAAVKLDKSIDMYYIERGKLFKILGDFESALQDFDAAIKIDNSNTVSIGYKALLLIVLERWDEAEILLNKTLILDPSFSWGYQLRSYINIKRSEHVRALEDIFQALELEPSTESYRNDFFEYADSNINYTLNKLNAKISQNQDNITWLELRGRIYLRQLKYVNALSDINRCIELSDPDYKYYYQRLRGKLYFDLGNYSASISDFMNTINEENKCRTQFKLAECYVRSGDFKKALEYYDSVTTCNPTDIYLFAKRAILKYQYLNDYEGALADFDQAIAMNKYAIYLYEYKASFLKNCNYQTDQLNSLWNTIVDKDTSIGKEWNFKPLALFHLGKKEEALKYQEEILSKTHTQQSLLDAARFYALMKNELKTIELLKKTIAAGSAIFYEIEHSPEIISMMSNQNVAAFIKEQHAAFLNQNASLLKDNSTVDSSTTQIAVIPMKPKGSGTYEVSCKVNELSLNFIFDTGASDISISQTEALFMLKNGYLSNNDIVGSRKYIDANGDIEIGTKIILRKVDFGGLILKNVAASVVNNKKAPLLFGQSALSKYGKIEINNKNNTVTITQTERK